MPTKKKIRPKVPRSVVAVVQPVTKRLARIEDLLIEMRGEQDTILLKIQNIG